MTADLSIVIQGPIKAVSDGAGFATAEVVRSARRHYPDAEIIYSGWAGTELPAGTAAELDAVVLSADPGPLVAFRTAEGDVVQNVNRQIVSTVEGLRRATGFRAMKLRSDTLVVGDGRADWHARQAAKKGRTTLFEEPVVVAGQFTRLFFLEYGELRPSLGHLSDLFFYGRRSDLLRYWDRPLIATHEATLPNHEWAPNPEQMLALRFLGGLLENKFVQSVGDLDVAAWQAMLRDNFVVLSEGALLVRHPPRCVRLGLSRFAFDTDDSIDAVSGELGQWRRLSALAPKVMAVAEYRFKSVARKIIGENAYKGINRSVATAAGKTAKRQR